MHVLNKSDNAHLSFALAAPNWWISRHSKACARTLKSCDEQLYALLATTHGTFFPLHEFACSACSELRDLFVGRAIGAVGELSGCRLGVKKILNVSCLVHGTRRKADTI